MIEPPLGGGSSVRVIRADWRTDRAILEHIRFTVFVHEQGVPAEEEIDDRDPISQHVLAMDHTGRPLGTGRIQQNGRIGRMAVLAEARRQGVGGAILDELIEIARAAGLPKVILSAQVHAIGFYASRGFVLNSDIYMDAGIPHRDMVLDMNTRPASPTSESTST